MASIKSQLKSLQSFSEENFLSEHLAYHPHLVFYIRKNSGRFLLKINKDNLYKHGWKNHVNWGPIRESIAASILHQSKIFQKSDNQEKVNMKIWDPMCGSGTFGLVATTMIEQIPVRSDV
jgi:23S rRNA G2445 N2-methylase RlmL